MVKLKKVRSDIVRKLNFNDFIQQTGETSSLSEGLHILTAPYMYISILGSIPLMVAVGSFHSHQ